MRPIAISIGRLILPLFFFFQAQAETCAYSQTIHGPFTFNQVELISRVHSIGLYRGGTIRLQPWIEVSENAFLGIDGEGRVLNVLKLKDRTVAFLLSGGRKMKDLFFRAPGTLLGVDDSGQLLQFLPAKWSDSSTNKIVRTSLRNYGVTMCSVGLGLLLYSWLGEVPLDSVEILASLGMASVGGLQIEIFRAMTKFEDQNESTDGFIPLGAEIPGFRRSDFVRSDRGVIEDYLLKSRDGDRLLGELTEGLVRDSNDHFDVKCEHELLARGIPPEEYEPKF